MSNTTKITGKHLTHGRTAFGHIWHETGGTREFSLADVVRAGTFVTYGVRGARCMVELADGARYQVARTKLPKDVRKALDALIGDAWALKRCPSRTTQVVKMGEPVKPAVVTVKLVNWGLRDEAHAWLWARGVCADVLTSDMLVASNVPADVAAEFASAFSGVEVA